MVSPGTPALWPGSNRHIGVMNGREDVSWKTQGRCAEVDPDLFFPEKGESSNGAKLVCRGCEVQEQCLAYAMKHGIRWGVWGGTSERQRQRMRSQRDATGAAA